MDVEASSGSADVFEVVLGELIALSDSDIYRQLDGSTVQLTRFTDD